MMRVLCFFFAAISIQGCATSPTNFYSVRQVDIEQSNAYQKTTDLIDTSSSTFEDEMVKVQFRASGTHLGIDITNLSDDSIYLVWDEAAYIDPEGTSHRVIHTGVKYINKEQPQPNTVIPSGATISDAIVSTDHIVYFESSGWMDYMLGPKLVGKKIKVLLPFLVDDETVEYLFHLDIMDGSLIVGDTGSG